MITSTSATTAGGSGLTGDILGSLLIIYLLLDLPALYEGPCSGFRLHSTACLLTLPKPMGKRLGSIIPDGSFALMSDTTFTPRVFSGIQPSGNLHLGNYLGALKRFVDWQARDVESIYCMVDLHAITVWQDPKDLRQSTRELCAGFIAAGLDPENSILINQSQVPEHAQLAWIFNCVARMGWMQRMTQFKDKAGKNAQNASLGLFAYPALMAADILVYHATHVPVGEDQKQHLELTRDIAAKFNHDYGVDFFPMTEPVIEGAATRVMSLRDGSKKMSKSDVSDASRINMTDDADAIAKKIRKAKTDPDALPSEAKGLEERAEARNLVNIFAALNEQSVDQVLADVGGKQFSEFKPMLVDLAVAKLSPISTEMARLMQHPDEIDKILTRGSQRARAITAPILRQTYEIVGMVPPVEV
jgi:tryptophanyl-tRNA synthetase